MSELTAIVVEDQPIIWDYIRSCLEPHYKILDFCSSTVEAEELIRNLRPNLVWLDCYLGEFSEQGLGIKNSGIELAYWIKKHNPQTKIFLFTASNEGSIIHNAKEIGIEGIALGGKFFRDKSVIQDGVKALASGYHWYAPNLIAELELQAIANVTVFEFAVLSAFLLGKNTAQIADELDTTRKSINNVIYRVKQKFCLSESLSRYDLLDIFKDKIRSSFTTTQYYALNEIITVNSVIERLVRPLLTSLKTGNLDKIRLSDINNIN